MSGALRSIRETCQPRPDVLTGGMSDSQFAAQLDKVVRDSGGGYEVYSEPDRFFELTYPTSGLRELLGRTFGRLAGVKGDLGDHGVIPDFRSS